MRLLSSTVRLSYRAPIVFARIRETAAAIIRGAETTTKAPRRAPRPDRRTEMTLPRCGLLLMEIQFLLIQFQFDCRVSGAWKLNIVRSHAPCSLKYLLTHPLGPVNTF